MVETDAFGHFGGGFDIEVLQGVDMQTLDGFGMLPSDFLDLGATVCRGKDVEIT